MRIADTPLDPTPRQPWAVVLDTNVVLDWLVFNDASCSSLAEQLVRGRLRWQATAEMRAELCSVLPRPELKIWNPDGEHVLSVFDRLACLHAPSRAQQPGLELLCRDPDDQKFMDLAVATNARWLFTRDRALLDLAKTARKHGVAVLTPASWLRQQASRASHGDCGGSA